jgi:glycosyltransferase involved in cell wall biosynthesis
MSSLPATGNNEVSSPPGEGPPLQDNVQAAIGALEALAQSLYAARGPGPSSRDRNHSYENVLRLTNSALVEQARSARVISLLFENPSLFRGNPHDGLDHVWQLRRRWQAAVSAIAQHSTENLTLLASMAAEPPPPVAAAPPPTQLAPRLDHWLGLLSTTAVHFARRAKILERRQHLRSLSPSAEAPFLRARFAAQPKATTTPPHTEALKNDIDQQILLIQRSGLFDESYYLSQLDSNLPKGTRGLEHYVRHGWRAAKDPNPLFSVSFYLNSDPTLRANGTEPLTHYLQTGSDEQRDPHPLFNTIHFESAIKRAKPKGITWIAYFLSADNSSALPHPLFDLPFYSSAAGLNKPTPAFAFLHYLVIGCRHGLSMSPLFSPQFYLSQLASEPETTHPYIHYITEGLHFGLNPHPLFDTNYYLQTRPALAELGLDPLVDYTVSGEAAGALPSPFFDPAYYQSRYLEGQSRSGALRHFLVSGYKSDHKPFESFDSAEYRQLFMVDMAASTAPSAIEHFLVEGIAALSGKNSKDLVRPVAPISVTKRSEKPSIVPIPSIPIELQKTLQFKHFPGKRKYIAGLRHVLVVAHAAAEHLFGSERSFLDMLDGLAAAQMNVFVVLPRNAPTYTNAIREKCNYVVTFTYGWWRKDVATTEPARNAFRNLIDGLFIDAVHSNTIMLRECLEAARKAGIPSVVHVRELITHDQALVDLIGESAETIIDEVHSRADWIMGNSKLTADVFHKPGRTFTIPNTINVDDFALQNPVNNAKVRFGLISSNIPKKGLADVVTLAREVAISCPEAEFLLIGPETDAVKEILRLQQCDQAPRNLIFPGYAASPRDAVSQVQVVLNFSHFAESFGRTVLEAMAAGRPVIAYEWGALPELIVHGKTGYLVPYGKPELAASHVTELCRNPQRISELGEQGRAIARNNYGIDRYGKQFAKAYEAILPPPLTIDTSAGPVIRPARLPDLKQVNAPARVAYFCWHFPVPSETFVLNEIEVLVRQKVDVIVFCRQSPHKDFVLPFPVHYERVDTPKKLAQRLKETSRTIVHAHFVYPTVTDMVWPACEEAHVPFTFMAHAQDIFKYDNDRRNRLAEIGKSRWCRKLFTLSRFHLDFVATRGFPRNKIVINPNAVNTTRFLAADVPQREQRLFRRIISVHRFVAKKGLSQLIEAAALVKDMDVVIDIYGYGELESEYRALIEKLGLENVVIHGPLTQDEVVEAMRKADLFACPSVRTETGDMDGIPTSIVEGMAAGIPILTTAVAGIPDLITDGITGIIAEPTPQSIAAAIRRFYSMPTPKVLAIINAARERSIRNHDATRTVRVLTRVWENRTTDIVIVSWNNLQELRGVVERILSNTALPYHLIVCDNQSAREPVAQFLDSLWSDEERVTVIHNNRNAMVGPGTNIALSQGKSDYAIYVCGKEGFSFANGWEIPFIHAFDADTSAGLVGTIGHSPSYLTGEQYPTGIPLFSKFRNQHFANQNKARIFGHAQGGLFGIRRKMYDEIGGFSEDVPHDYTDVEYSYYAESRGWKIIEARGVLALFNKSRPSLSQRFDESILVAHPVLLPQVARFNAVRAGKLHHCNICDWYGPAFTEPDTLCANCQSRPSDRTLYRWLSESPYLYRRLPSLSVGLAGQMERTWSEQFQGLRLGPTDFIDTLYTHGRLKTATSALHLAVVRIGDEHAEHFARFAKELSRVLKPGALAVFQAIKSEIGLGPCQPELCSALIDANFVQLPEVVFSSYAVQLDYCPMLVFSKGSSI